jgi:cytochrome c5
MRAIVLGLCTAMVLVVRVAEAQMPLPAAKPPDGAALFKQQCAVCHTTNLSEPVRNAIPATENRSREMKRRTERPRARQLDGCRALLRIEAMRAKHLRSRRCRALSLLLQEIRQP